MNTRIAVAMSGGIDSLVTAHLLEKKGYAVFGIHFLTGYEDTAEAPGTHHPQRDPVIAARERLSPLAHRLGLDIHVIDGTRQFRKAVVDYFTHTYLAGETPNPCMVCNPTIKFGFLFEEAHKLGARSLATGHYAIIDRDPQGSYHLIRGRDRQKDQSYFLARMTQRQLGRTLLPLGTWTKTEVRAYAAENNLVPLATDESQDVCFIRHKKYSDFLMELDGVSPEPGPIEDVDGNLLGRHKGLMLYTVGQRRGIDCPAPEPYYVVRLDTARNRLVVGGKKDLLRPNCLAVGMNWIAMPPTTPLEADVRIRYRHEPVPAKITPVDHETAAVTFVTPQPAVTPGQGVVIYRGEEVIGGGWIKLDA
jgi:tRNA-uridine 2-sulfurtransferase